MAWAHTVSNAEGCCKPHSAPATATATATAAAIGLPFTTPAARWQDSEGNAQTSLLSYGAVHRCAAAAAAATAAAPNLLTWNPVCVSV
jgi:hypothetical protein